MGNLLKDIPDPGNNLNLKTIWENVKRLNLLHQPTYYTSLIEAKSSLSALITAIGSSSVTLYVNSTVTVSANLTIPSNISVVVLKGGSFSISTGVTMTINGTLEAPCTRIFTLAGTAAVVGNRKIHGVNPYWFGAGGLAATDDLTAIEDAIQFADTCDRVLNLYGGYFAISDNINLKTLLNISDTDVNQGYFTIQGLSPEQSRIIPYADIPGGMIECVNAGIGNAANARQLKFKDFALYSDDTLNKTAEYGFHLKWCAEVYYHNVRVMNCATKRLVFHDVVFVVTFKDCNFIGNDGSEGDTGTDEPDDIAYAYNNVSQTFTASDSSGNLLLTFAAGMANLAIVNVSNSGGSLPGNLSASTDYWLVRVTTTTYRVATSEANALAGTYVAYSSAGTGTHTAAIPAIRRLTGVYFANTSTTTTIDTCRVKRCRVGVNFNNGDGMTLLNTAPESNADYGMWLSGSTTNIRLAGDTYWEGNTAHIYVTARADALDISGCFFNSADWGVKIVSATIRGGLISCCHFKTVDGIILDAPSLDSLSIHNNYFDVDDEELSYPDDTLNSYGTNGHRLDWYNNFSTTNGKLFSRSERNYNLIDFQDWSVELLSTRTPSNKKSKVANVYDVTYPNQNGFIHQEIFEISSTRNQDFRGAWVTILLPLKFTSIVDISQTAVISNSGGDLLITYATDFPDGAVITFTTTGSLSGTNLTAGTSYWVKRQSATTAKLATSYDNYFNNILIAFSSAGTGTHTATFKDPGGKVRVNDGVTSRDFLIGGIATNLWATRRIYTKLSATATTLNLRLYPHGADIAVENFVVLKGLHGDTEVGSAYYQKMYLRPNSDSGTKPFRMYQSPTSSNLVADIDNQGSPAYGVFGAYDASGTKSLEMHGISGFRTLIAGLPLSFQEGPHLQAGASSPEGNVTASPGACYLRTDGTIWLKASGSGNTGWVALASTSAPTFTGLLKRSATTGITASTTQTQGQQALTTDINIVSTCANANDVVTLPAAVAGAMAYIRNNGAQTLQIFPASGDAINGAAANASATLAAGASVTYRTADSTNWYS